MYMGAIFFQMMGDDNDIMVVWTLKYNRIKQSVNVKSLDMVLWYTIQVVLSVALSKELLYKILTQQHYILNPYSVGS